MDFASCDFSYLEFGTMQWQTKSLAWSGSRRSTWFPEVYCDSYAQRHVHYYGWGQLSTCPQLLYHHLWRFTPQTSKNWTTLICIFYFLGRCKTSTIYVIDSIERYILLKFSTYIIGNVLFITMPFINLFSPFAHFQFHFI